MPPSPEPPRYLPICWMCEANKDVSPYRILIETQRDGEFAVMNRLLGARLMLCGRCRESVNRMGLEKVEE